MDPRIEPDKARNRLIALTRPDGTHGRVHRDEFDAFEAACRG